MIVFNVISLTATFVAFAAACIVFLQFTRMMWNTIAGLRREALMWEHLSQIADAAQRQDIEALAGSFMALRQAMSHEEKQQALHPWRARQFYVMPPGPAEQWPEGKEQ